ncbi:MAG: hypothetical protein J0H43_04160 [Actinobacteria bacterium]|nr:hypothetical protein [Actinomycetota bacterium]
MVPALVAGEIAFWVVLLAGLLLRYRFDRPRASVVVLLLVPVIDLVLLALLIVSLRRGDGADASSGLAAVYLGVSIAFGQDLVAWADRTWRRAPKLPRSPWPDFGKAVLAGVISAALLGICVLLAADSHAHGPLLAWYPRIGVVLAIWLVTTIYDDIKFRRGVDSGSGRSTH